MTIYIDVALGGVAIGRAFDGCEDGRQIGIQAFVGVGTGGDGSEQLAGVDEVAFGFNGVIFDFRGDHAIVQLCIVDAVIIGFDVAGKVFADEAIEQRAEYVLLEIPAIDRATDIVGDSPDCSVKCGSFLFFIHIRHGLLSLFLWVGNPNISNTFQGSV